jgi:hypothetical protein
MGTQVIDGVEHGIYGTNGAGRTNHYSNCAGCAKAGTDPVDFDGRPARRACEFCGFAFEATLGRYGCPNCEAGA